MKTRAYGINRQRFAWLVVASVLMFAALTACGQLSLPGQPKTFLRDGSLRITFSLACLPSQTGCDIQRLAAQTRDILQQRAINGLGVADAVARLDGNSRIVVELPAYNQETRALAVLGQRGEVNFIETSGTPLMVATDVSTKLCTSACTPGQYAIVFTGAQLDPNALSATRDQQSQQPTVTFAFAQPYRQQFADYTRQHIGQYLTIALDDKVIESATIQSEIDGQGQITGLASMDDAQALVTDLRYHALPLAVTVTESVSAIPSSANH